LEKKAPNHLGRPLTDFPSVFSISQRTYPAKTRRLFFPISKSVLPSCLNSWSGVQTGLLKKC